MKNFTIIFVWLFFISALVYAQNADVKTYFDDHFIGGLATHGEYIWVGVDSLLIIMNKTSGTTFSHTLPISSEYKSSDRYASSISLDNNGQAWIRCIGPVPYLLKFDGVKTWTEIPIPSPWFSDLIVDKNNNIWAATHLGLHKYDGIGWIDYNALNTDMPCSSVTALAVDEQNNKWLGLSFDGLKGPGYLVEFDDQQFTTYPCSSYTTIWSIDVSLSGTVWMGTWLSGLIKFDGTGFAVYNPSIPGLPANSFEYVNVEGESIVWLSPTIGIGLIRFDRVNWETFNTDNSMLPSNHINSILVEENGTKWVGTDKGLISFKGSTLSALYEQNSGVQFNLFPNPANDFINLKVPLDFAGSTIEVFNIQGKVMKTVRMINNDYKMDTSDLASGMYFIRLQNNNGMAIKKFIKQN